MQKNLVIVESPAKAKTIEKFLGKDYKVLSSYGHIRDLKQKAFSIDVLHGFAPTYEIPADKKKLVHELKTESAKADMVWLASDEDREGEAISWHLYEVLGLNPEKTKRIVFHEITKTAILNAIEHPRDIDVNLVNAQQARRVLDRIVGFELSPVLWRKVKPALSAGRVQSVAVRLIVEREREAQQFVSEPSFRVTAVFTLPGEADENSEVRAELNERFRTQAEAEAFLQTCQGATFTIDDIQTRPLKKSPAAPFTTSTLQQEAARKLGFTVAQTMMVAQHLYESGKITYMRTDSVNLSSLALGTAREAITGMMGERYVKTRQFATKSKGAQEAHEAIRPTYLADDRISGNAQEQRLYELIWKRTIASQMADAELEKTTATISVSGSPLKFVATGEVVTFDGFLRVYRESYDEDLESEDESRLLPPLAKGDRLQAAEVAATERWSQCPPRYTEASLVRKMEELGIGRPSTYAPTISTVQQRGYVEKGNREGTSRICHLLRLAGGQITSSTKTEVTGTEKNKLLPTDIGIVVNDFLMEYFPLIMDYNFTANVEKEFDEVAEGQTEWTLMMDTFYKGFHPLVDQTLKSKTERKIGERVLGNDPATGRPVSVKIGRFGPVIQIGTADDAEKPRFAQLKKGLSLETITLDEALESFRLPRQVGELDGHVITVGIGRFGPYVRHEKTFVSIPKDADPLTITLEECQALLDKKRQAEAENFLKGFDDDPDLRVMNGRYGPYISYQKKNYKIPDGVEPLDLTRDACLKIVALQTDRATTRRAKASAAKTAKLSAGEKAPARKAPAKKTAKADEAKKTATRKSTAKTKES